MVCATVLKHELEKLNIKYHILGFGEVEFLETLSDIKQEAFALALSKYGIELVADDKRILVQKIKDTIVDMVYNKEADIQVKSSVYLSETLGHSYSYLANLFSEVTYTSIENFIIIQKIEYTKHLIITQDITLTEIAFKLGYSSVAHLSTQFKNTTGITPSAFQRIVTKRKEENS